MPKYKPVSQLTLQEQALKKLNKGCGFDARMTKNRAILNIATKESLTESDIAMLQHYIRSNSSVAENTVYYANSIYSPVTQDLTTHKVRVKP